MELKPHEIILAILAIAIPGVVLTLAFIPGGLDFLFDLALDRVWGPVVFFTGAAVLFVAVFPANVQHAVQADGAEQVGALLRLPLQVPLVLWALQVRRSARP